MYIFKDVCSVAHPSQDMDDGPFGDKFTLMHEDKMKKRSTLIVQVFILCDFIEPNM